MNRFAWCVAVLATCIFVSPALAQQNLFNVPSVEATEKDRIFFQNQFNVNILTQSNLTLCYGLGNGFEIGMNLFDVPIYNPSIRQNDLSRELQEPDVLFNALKVFDITEKLKVGVGTQIGQNAVVFDNKVNLLNFTYANAAYDLPSEFGKLYAGLCYANPAYRGRRGDPIGFMCGYDIPIVKEKFHLMGDLITGRNDISVAVIGAVVYLPRGWQISLGAQLPSPRSDNAYGGVIELTYVPKSDKSESNHKGME